MTKTTDFYSFRHGDFDITVLSDGASSHGEDNSHALSLPLEANLSKDVSGADEIGLAPSNIPLIVISDEVILIDVGAGEKKSENVGLLETNLRRIGVTSSDVTLIILTHAHPCHVWGLVRTDGSLRYQNARYIMSAAEWAFWIEGVDAASTDYERLTGGITRKTLAAVLGRITLVEDGDEILPGLRVLSSTGRTPGHISVILDGDIPLIIIGDAVASDVVAFEHPDWNFGFDLDAEQAGRTRRRLLAQADEERAKLLGFRWHYPGVGRAERSGSAFRLRRVGEVAR